MKKNLFFILIIILCMAQNVSSQINATSPFGAWEVFQAGDNDSLSCLSCNLLHSNYTIPKFNNKKKYVAYYKEKFTAHNLNQTVKGIAYVFKWCGLENPEGSFVWANNVNNVFDNNIIAATLNGFYVSIIVWVGPDSPGWIYYDPQSNPNGYVSPFYTIGSGTECTKWPDYLNKQGSHNGKNYFDLWKNMHAAVAARIKWLCTEYVYSNPDSTQIVRNAIKAKFLGIQSAEGSTGDADAYKNPIVDPLLRISAEEWATNFQRPAWQYLKGIYATLNQQLSTNFHVIVNTGIASAILEEPSTIPENNQLFSTGISNFEWLQDPVNNMTDVWLKAAHAAHFYQSNEEKSFKYKFDPRVNNIGSNGEPSIRCRDEIAFGQSNSFDPLNPGNETCSGNSSSAGKENYFYWNAFNTAASALYLGVDMWYIPSDIIEDPRYSTANTTTYSNNTIFDIIEFYNASAGKKNAQTANGGFSVMHFGLDAYDNYDCPEGNPNDNSGKDRTKCIASKFSAYGAKQPNPKDAQGGPVNQLNTKYCDVNDVGWDIFTGNYEKFLYQKSPELTSQPYWRVPTTTIPGQISMYGRFSRGIQNGTSKDALYYDIDNILMPPITNLNTIVGYDVDVTVTFFDEGVGEIKLFYDAVDDPNKEAGIAIDGVNGESCILSGSLNKKYDSKQWGTIKFCLRNARFNNRAGVANFSAGSDFYIKNVASTTELTRFALVTIGKIAPGNGGGGTGLHNLDISNNSKKLKDLIIQPNPTDGRFSLILKNNELIKEIYIYNSAGLLITHKLGNSSKMSMLKSEISNTSGIYFVRVLDSHKNILTGQIIIK